jgi:hypothetical protein
MSIKSSRAAEGARHCEGVKELPCHEEDTEPGGQPRMARGSR